jgi:hypothetical protein
MAGFLRVKESHSRVGTHVLTCVCTHMIALVDALNHIVTRNAPSGSMLQRDHTQPGSMTVSKQ